ncbi:MAG: transketolase [Herpetosiphonaceae bacterium]|nr:MAG: transketolase [Herpetosiphonaceae bacterium]
MEHALDRLHQLAQQLRIDSIRSTTAAGSGHPTTCLSAADLMAVLLARYLRYDFSQPDHPNNDQLIFSKGHAAPLLYALYKAAGAISDRELMTLRELGSPLEGHPRPVLPWVKVATGSLGQGLPIGVGVALAGKYLERLPYKVWVLLGDSEMAEGSVWEAMELSGHYQLDNLIGILDMNRLGQRGPTMVGWNGEVYAARAQAFGWHTIQIDGHNLEEIDRAYAEAVEHQGSPTLIIARTLKGKGASMLEDKDGWHGKALPPEEAEKAVAELGGERHITVEVRKPESAQPAPRPAPSDSELPRYEVGKQIATRAAYGEALRALGDRRPEVVALDAEVSNSTYAYLFAEAHPNRYFEIWIAEQQMVAAAVGLQVRTWVPFASTFAAFMTRAYDFIRMAAISQANIRLCGSHAGVSIGEDGPSQMALEDLAMMRAVYGSTVLYPCDGNQTAQLVEQMAERSGIVYMRTTREKTPVLYPADMRFTIGGSAVLRSSDKDQVAVIAAGITVHEALKAYDELERDGINVRIIDAYSVKPIDTETLWQAAQQTGGRLVTVEDHWPEGGLGEAVLEALADRSRQGQLQLRVAKLGVGIMPGSGKPHELLDAAGISARHIVDAVRSLVE